MGRVDKKIVFLMLVILLCAALLGNEISNYRQLTYELNYFTVEDVSKKIITGALGEFGKTLAAYLWIKSDFYWHEYGGDLRTDKEIMPLIKIITMLDANMAQAYDFGGYQLAMGLDKVKEGVAYLKEGLKNNPDNANLNFTYALVCFKKIKNYYAAAEYAKRTFALSNDSAQKINSLRIIYNSHEQLGEYKEALNTVKFLLKIRPNDTVGKTKLELYQGKLNYPSPPTPLP